MEHTAARADSQSEDALGGWIYSLLLSATLFGFPIVSVIPIILHTGSRPYSIAYRILIVLVSLGFVIRCVLEERPFLESTVRWCLAGFAMMLLLRMFWDSYIDPLPVDVPWDDYWQQVIGITVISSIPFLAVPRDSWLVRAQRVSLYAGLLCVVSIVIGVIYSVKSLVSGSGRLATDVLNPISIGAAGVAIYIVASTLKLRRGLLVRIVKGMCLLAGPALCLLSGSKAPILALLFVILVQYLFPAKTVSMAVRLTQAALLAAVVASVVSVSLWIADNSHLYILSRFETASTDESTMERILVWSSALSQFNQSPLFGNAAFEMVFRSYPHNDILESLMATGLAGFSLYLFVLVVGLVSTFKQLRTANVRWLSLLFIQVFFGEMTSGSLYYSSIFWVMLLSVIAAGSRSASSLSPGVSPLTES